MGGHARQEMNNPPRLRQDAYLHIDAALLVIDKPAGLLSVPGRGLDKADCLAARAQAEFPDALIVHRLDMDTSGLLLMARGLDAQRRMSRAFAERRVEKRYVALVAGRMPPPRAEWGTVDLPLVCDWPNRPLQKVDAESGKPSVTRWRVLDYDAEREATRVELMPVTGRSHQLRVHMRELGHPMLGDPLYAPPAVRARASRLLLHASVLRFSHPEQGRAMVFESAPPF
jgi:tRNA pseudouridine32 synthase/23S rRNA pseudouridine746 synthase